MLLAPRYNGLDIPVLPPETEVIFYPKPHRPQPEEDSFVRAVKVRTPHFAFSSLGRALHRTDQELAEIAERCEIDIVEHRWGLVKLSPQKRQQHWEFVRNMRPELRIPRGHVVVAEVETIHGGSTVVEQGHPDISKITSGMDAYHRGKGIKLGDVNLKQVMLRPPFNDCVFVDIEPIFMRHDGSLKQLSDT